MAIGSVLVLQCKKDMQNQSLKVLECHSKDIIFYSAGTSHMEEKKRSTKANVSHQRYYREK